MASFSKSTGDKITGEKDQGYVQITQMPDLQEGAEIVNEGAFYLISEMKKGKGGTTI